MAAKTRRDRRAQRQAEAKERQAAYDALPLTEKMQRNPWKYAPAEQKVAG